MSPLPARGERGEGDFLQLAASARFVARITDWPGGPVLALLALCLAVYLPGVMRLPAVDRTEIVFAETTRAMVQRGDWLDPRYGELVHAFRPIGTFWAQGAAATVAGPRAAHTISVYRLPSLLAVTLAVLSVFVLAAPTVGRPTALLAAGLFAVAPLTVLVSQLAIADGLALLPATVAMLALLRLYDPEPGAPLGRLALLFWAAMGVGMLVNALHTPILVGVTLVALAAFDRDPGWLRRTRPLVGVPVALAVAAPWLMVRTMQDGTPFSSLGWHEFLAALGGAQDMKLRAFPGTFTIAALLGFLPGAALLPTAMMALWGGRGDTRLARFLLAWITGYIAYLELLSSKPGTYTVQVMFPAMALAVARLVSLSPSVALGRGEGRGEVQRPAPEQAAAPHPRPLPMASAEQWGEGIRSRWSLIPWPPLAALFALGLFGGVYGFAGEWPSPLALLLIVAVAALFAWSAFLGRRGHLAGWAVKGIAALALFASTLLGVVFPGVKGIWPARQALALVEETCGDGEIDVLGFREPSATFVLHQPVAAYGPETLPVTRGSLHLVESRWLERYRTEMAANGIAPGELGCIEAFNTMRGCPLTFTLLAVDAERRGCRVSAKHACTLTKTQVRPSSRGCD